MKSQHQMQGAFLRVLACSYKIVGSKLMAEASIRLTELFVHI